MTNKEGNSVGSIPNKWVAVLEKQTVPLSILGGQSLVLLAWGLPEEPPTDFAVNFTEQLVWVLRSQRAKAIVQPLYTTFKDKIVPPFVSCGPSVLQKILDGGAIAIVEKDSEDNAGNIRASLLQAIVEDKLILTATAALISERDHLPLTTSFKNLATAKLGKALDYLQENCTGQYQRILQIIPKIVVGNCRRAIRVWKREWKADYYLAQRKEWPPKISRLTIPVQIPPPDKRIPVLMALQWLELGGAEKFAIHLARHLPKDRYAVYLMTSKASTCKTWENLIRPSCEEIVHLPSFLGPTETPAFIDHFIRTRKIELLHIHHARPVYEAMPFVRRFHPKLKVVDTLHIIELPPHGGGFPEFSAHFYEQFIDAHHCVSQHVSRFLEQRWAVLKEKIHCIYLNVDTDYFNPRQVIKGSWRKPANIADDNPVVTFIGRFCAQKRPLTFIKMAEALRQRWLRSGHKEDIHFIMAGSGPLLDQIKETLQKTTIPKETFHIFDAQEDPRPLYLDSNVIVLPSENEGLALVTYESLAMGTPVVSTDVGAQSELLPPELLVKNDNRVETALVEKVLWLLTQPGERQQLASELCKYVNQSRQFAQTLGEIEKLYTSLVGSSSSHSV